MPEPVHFYFLAPEEMPPLHLKMVRGLISSGAAVGMSWTDENLENAFLIGYAVAGAQRVVGCMVLKRPKETYLEKLRVATGLDLSGYLERGYTSVHPAFRGRGIADRLIDGLDKRSQGLRIYVTIRLTNGPAIHLTRKHGMRLAGDYVNPRTGNLIGIFVNTAPGIPPG